MRRLMAVDITFDGLSSVLTVAFDDASDDAISLSINASGYSATGANETSGTGTISQLIVTDAGTVKSSDFTLLQADQTLTGGLFIASNITAARIEDSVTTSGGDISIGANCLTSFTAITLDSGAGNQTYAGPVALLGDVTVNAMGGGTVASSGGLASATPGTSALTIDAGTAGAVTFSGAATTVAGNVSVAARNIVITADLVSTSGDILLTGDAGATVTGVFHRVHLNGSGVGVKTLATDLIAGATGAITVQGRGGDAVAAGSASQAFGVYLHSRPDTLTSRLTLGLSTAEIDRITAGTPSVNSATAGVATVSIPLTPANVTNLAIRSAAGVTLAGHIMLAGYITTDGGTITIDDGAGGDTAATLKTVGSSTRPTAGARPQSQPSRSAAR